MTLSSLARLLLRRWYVAVLGLVMTTALGGVALRVVQPEYDAAGSILLLPPANPGANPYLDLAAVPGVPEVISRVLHDSKYADKYDAEGIKEYEVTPDQSAGGPAVLVIGKGSTNDEALRAMLTVMADVLPVLQELQDDAGVENPNLITGRQIYVETEATKVGKKQTRALIAAVGAGLVLTLFLVVAVDAMAALVAARRARRGRSDDQDSDDRDSDELDEREDPDEPDDPDDEDELPPHDPGPEVVEEPDEPAPARTPVLSGTPVSRSSRRSSKRSAKRPAKRPAQRPGRPLRASGD